MSQQATHRASEHEHLRSPTAQPRASDAITTPLGSWINELGSHLRLASAPAGGLSGSFASAVGVTQKARPVVGFRGRPRPDGSVILGFVVCWPDSGSISAWSGRFDAREDRIHAEWLLVCDSDPEHAWRATMMGCDDFERVAAP